ncbi:MAG: four helix bundle protein [Candidatus Kapabacteria bacterium]|nr:four helix bundle protein [Candidatus Kapabacteria bacterium]
MIRSYRDLDIWKRSVAKTVECYRITSDFPKTEQYGLAQQLRRVASSVPMNISEGYSRRSSKEYVRYLNIASGSIAEVESADTEALFLEECASIGKMIGALRRKIEANIASGKSLGPNP